MNAKKGLSKRSRRNKAKKAKKQNNGSSERIITMGRNFPGAPIYRYRLRLGSINISSSGAGAVSGVTSITKSMLTTDGSNIVDAFQKYRMWKTEVHVYGCTVGSGLARFFLYDYSLSASPEDNTQYKIAATNTASALSYQSLSYTAVDYPDLDFVDFGAGTNFCKFGYENVGNSVFAVSTLVYVAEVWGHFECKIFGS